MEFTVLLDAPGKPVKRIQIAKLGTFTDSRYGEFEITSDQVEEWKKNLGRLPGGEALIDFEHRSERKPRDSKAAGWISGIDLDGDRVMADARWTPEGEQSIKDETYRFLSPVFGPVQVEGETLDEALPSVALTNKPFLASMPALCLASEERVSEAVEEDPAIRFHVRALDGEYGEVTQALVMLDVSQAERDQAVKENNALPDGSYPIRNPKQLHSAAVLAASGHGNVAAAKKLIRRRAKELGVDVKTLPGFGGEKKQMSADSRDAMDTALLKMLDLPEDADDAAVTAKLTELKTTAAEAADLKKRMDKKPRKTLEAQAEEAGLVVLDADTVKTLRRQAAAGETALKQLHSDRFERTFDAALNDPKGPRVKPAEKEDLQKVYELDADLAISMIEGREPILSAKPTGPTGDPALAFDPNDVEGDPQIALDAGLVPQSVVLDAAVRKHMKDNNLGPDKYATVLEGVYNGTVQL